MSNVKNEHSDNHSEIIDYDELYEMKEIDETYESSHTSEMNYDNKKYYNVNNQQTEYESDSNFDIDTDAESVSMSRSTRRNNNNDAIHEFQNIKMLLMRTEMMMGEVFQKMNMMCNRIEGIESKIAKMENSTHEKFTEIHGDIIRLKEVKPENLNIPEDEVMKALVYKDYRSFIYVFKYCYQHNVGGKIFYPIKMKSKRIFEYFYNNQWLEDSNGHYITKTICNNIQNVFLKYNIFDEKSSNDEEFFLNQQYIQKLSKESYKKEIFKHIIDEIMIAK